jgi:hypothetical protein
LNDNPTRFCQLLQTLCEYHPSTRHSAVSHHYLSEADSDPNFRPNLISERRVVIDVIGLEDQGRADGI